MHKLKAVIAWLFTPVFNVYVDQQAKRKKLAVLKSWDDLHNKELATFTTKIEKLIAEAVLKNQREFLMREGSYNSAVNSVEQQQTIFRITANVVRGFSTVGNLVGVQPLTGPVGLVYSLKYTYDEKIEDDSVMTNGRKVKLAVIKDTVEAGTRRLAARWTPEAAHDALHGEDIRSELEHVIGLMISGEILEEVISNLIDISVKEDVVVVQGPQDFSKLIININRAASLIAARSRRGAGNFIVVSPITLSAIQSSPFSVFKSAAPDETIDSTLTLKYAGTLNGTIKVYTSMTIGDKVLVGYKGGSGECDTGYIYSPYIPVMTTGVMIDPQTFAPVVGMMTRYGKTVMKQSEEYLMKASDYYTTFDVKYDFVDPVLGIDHPTVDHEVEQHIVEKANATIALNAAVEVTNTSVDSQ